VSAADGRRRGRSWRRVRGETSSAWGDGGPWAVGRRVPPARGVRRGRV